MTLISSGTISRLSEPVAGVAIPDSKLARDVTELFRDAVNGSRQSTPVAPEIKEALTAIVINASACWRWLSTDPPDIRQARAATERMISNASALAKLISTPEDDDHA